MVDIKELIYKIRHAVRDEEIRDALVEAFTSMYKTFTSRIEEQKDVLEKARQGINKEILYLRISIVVLFILLMVNQYQQITFWKSVNAQIQEHNYVLERNNWKIEEIISILQKNSEIRSEEGDNVKMLSKKTDQESHFVVEIEPSRRNQKNQKRWLLSYAAKMNFARSE